MDGFLKMSPQERRLACLQVEEQMRLQAASVEKDFWICWTLRELFALPELDTPTFHKPLEINCLWHC